MENIICIVGLPGSGKSILADQIQAYYGGLLLDDPDITQIPYTGRVVVSSPHFCLQTAQDKLLAIRKDVIWICFENDFESCAKNAAERKKTQPEKEVIGTLHAYSKKYSFPEGHILIPVYKGDSHEAFNIVLASGVLQTQSKF